MSDPRYPHFVVTQRHVVDGYGLQRLCKDDRSTVVAAGTDAPWIDLLVAIAHNPWETAETLYEPGWFFAEREGDQWSFSAETIRGTFSIEHASLLRLCAAIFDLQAGRIPTIGEVVDADEWDRRYGWARESGLLDSHVDVLETLARDYVLLLREEGVTPGLPASGALLRARMAVTEALEREGVTAREQPDAIFSQLRERNAPYLHEVLDALDMEFHLTQRCGEILAEPGTDAWRKDLFAMRPKQPGKHHVAIDWWILDPAYPSDGTMGTIDLVHYCHQKFMQTPRVDLEPIPIELFGKQLYLLLGRYQDQIELRTVSEVRR